MVESSQEQVAGSDIITQGENKATEIGKASEDPLRRIELVLKAAAKTPKEKRLAQAATERLEKFRSNWIEILKQVKPRAQKDGESFNIEGIKETVAAIRRSNTTVTPVKVRTKDSVTEDFPCVEVLDVTDEEGTRIRPSAAFMRRILVGMGVLEQGKTLDDLKSLLWLQSRVDGGVVYYRLPKLGNYRGYEYADCVPTNITGVDVTVDFSGLRIHASINLPTFQRVVNFPVEGSLPNPA